MIGWGIIGTGAIARRFAADLALAPARLVAVVSRDTGRAQTFARQTGAAHALTDCDAMLAMADIAVVYIATPNQRHKADCLRAIAAGKAVLCEKPLCLNAADAADVATAAAAAGVFCMEGLWTHFVPALREAARLIAAGAIGTPQNLAGSFGSPEPFAADRDIFDPARGGGALLDRGVYPISLALRLLGPAASVTGTVVRGDTGVDLAAEAVLRGPGDSLAVIGASLVAHQSNDLIIGGSGGRIKLHEHITCPDLLTIWSAGPPGTVAAATSGLKKRLRGNRWIAMLLFMARQKLRHVPHRGHGLIHEIEEVHRCVAAGLTESPILPLSLSIATLAVIDQLLKTTR